MTPKDFKDSPNTAKTPWEAQERLRTFRDPLWCLQWLDRRPMSSETCPTTCSRSCNGLPLCFLSETIWFVLKIWKWMLYVLNLCYAQCKCNFLRVLGLDIVSMTIISYVFMDPNVLCHNVMKIILEGQAHFYAYCISQYKALPRIIPEFLIMPAPGTLSCRWI